MKICPECGQDIGDVTQKCPHCGKEITASTEDVAQRDVPQEVASDRSSSPFSVFMGVSCLLLLAFSVALYWPVFSGAGEASRRSICRNNLKQIGLALHDYHDAYASFPPAHVVDEKGTPLYSWRVLLLPYLEQKALYSEWDATQAWDSPANRRLSDTVLSVYTCPNSTDAGPYTNYIAPVGSDSVFPGTETITFDDITDPPHQTIMVAEMTGEQIPWAAPFDERISFEAVNSVGAVGSKHVGGMHVLFCDGGAGFVLDTVDATALTNLFNRHDGAGERDF